MTRTVVYRLSDYSIFVPLKSETNKYMVVHGYTGAIDILGEDIVRYLKENDRFTAEEFAYSDRIFDVLVHRGYLTEKSPEQEMDHLIALANALHTRNTKSAKHWMIVVTYNCNMRCPYCYESSISENGNCWSKKTVTKEQVDKIFEAFHEIEPDRSKHNPFITLYGGEPLLAENEEIVRYIVEKGNQLGYKFNAITNGYELENYADILIPEKFGKLQITLDGPREIHDVRRIHHITGKSYDKIISNTEKILKNGLKIVLRYNTDKTNFDGIKTVRRELEEAGLFRYKLQLSSALVQDVKEADGRESMTYLSRKDFVKMHEKENGNTDCQDGGMTGKLIRAITSGNPLSFSPAPCAAMFGTHFIFDACDDIYCCWEIIGKKNHVVGNYENGVELNENIENWSQRHTGNMPSCQRCKYSLICGGGCAGKALINKGGLYKSHCSNFEDTFSMSVNRAYTHYKKHLAKQTDM